MDDSSTYPISECDQDCDLDEQSQDPQEPSEGHEGCTRDQVTHAQTSLTPNGEGRGNGVHIDHLDIPIVQSQGLQQILQGQSDVIIKKPATQPRNQKREKFGASGNFNPPQPNDTDRSTVDILKQILTTLQNSKIVEPSGKDNLTRFWTKYKQVSEEYDTEFLDRHNGNMDILLIFAGLFSGINTAFILAMNPSPLNTTNVLLTQLIQASGGAVPTVPSKTNVWWSQPLAYASLSMSLLATLGAVLGKQWLVNYKSTRSGHGSLEERGLQRQDKLRGLEVWHLDAILQSFPVLLQLSLLIFGIALSGYVWTQEAATSGIVISVTAAGVLFYLFIVIASLHSSNCPFQTPASAILRLAWKRMIPTSLSQGITRRLSYWLQLPFNAIRSFSLSSKCLVKSLKKGLCDMCQPPRRRDRDVESGLSRPSVDEEEVIPLNIQDKPTSPYIPSLMWLIETSTDPDVVLAVASLVPDTDALLFQKGDQVSVLNIQLQHAFMSNFDNHDRCISEAYDKAIAPAFALSHMFWRRYLFSPDESMCLPGEAESDLPEGLDAMPSEWQSFERRWRYLESKDRNFRLISQTGIGWRLGAPQINQGLHLSWYSDAFIVQRLHNLSYSFSFVKDKKRIETLEGLGIDILSKLLRRSAPRPSKQVIADCTFLVLCMLGLRFSKKDVVNTNKSTVVHALLDELVWHYPAMVLAKGSSDVALRLAGVVTRILELGPSIHDESHTSEGKSDKGFIQKHAKLCIELLDREPSEPPYQEASARVRAAMRTIIVAGGPRSYHPDGDSLIWYGNFGWDSIQDSQVFQRLIKYLEHCRQKKDFIGLGDALLVTSDMWRFGTGVQKAFLDILIPSLNGESSRLRHIALRVSRDNRLALSTPENTQHTEIGQEPLITFSQALMISISLDIAPAEGTSHRQDTTQVAEPKDDLDSLSHKGRDLCYLQLLSAFVNTSDWIPSIVRDGHLNRCLKLLEQGGTSDLHLAVIFSQINVSNSACLGEITVEQWQKLMEDAWWSFAHDTDYLEDYIRALPTLVESTIKHLSSDFKCLSDLHKSVVMVLDWLEKDGERQKKSTVENLKMAIDERQRQHS